MIGDRPLSEEAAVSVFIHDGRELLESLHFWAWGILMPLEILAYPEDPPDVA